MTPENFIYWLQGFLEIQGPDSINKQQVEIIKDHVALVLKKETPQRLLQDLQEINLSEINFSVPPQSDGTVSFDGLTVLSYGGSC